MVRSQLSMNPSHGRLTAFPSTECMPAQAEATHPFEVLLESKQNIPVGNQRKTNNHFQFHQELSRAPISGYTDSLETGYNSWFDTKQQSARMRIPTAQKQEETILMNSRTLLPVFRETPPLLWQPCRPIFPTS